MPYQLSPELEQQLQQWISAGRYDCEEDVVQNAFEALRRHDGEVAAIQEGIDDMEAGRYQSIDDADAKIRAEHNFPPDQCTT